MLLPAQEVHIVPAADFLQFLPEETTVKNIFQAELILLRRLNWYLHPRTLFEYVSHILFAFQKYAQQPASFQNIKAHMQLPKSVFDKGPHKYSKYSQHFLDQLYLLMEVLTMDTNYSPKLLEEISFELLRVQLGHIADIDDYFAQFQRDYGVLPSPNTREWIRHYSQIIHDHPTLKNRLKIVEIKHNQTLQHDF